jgi:hypothetical protein
MPSSSAICRIGLSFAACAMSISEGTGRSSFSFVGLKTCLCGGDFLHGFFERLHFSLRWIYLRRFFCLAFALVTSLQVSLWLPWSLLGEIIYNPCFSIIRIIDEKSKSFSSYLSLSGGQKRANVLALQGAGQKSMLLCRKNLYSQVFMLLDEGQHFLHLGFHPACDIRARRPANAPPASFHNLTVGSVSPALSSLGNPPTRLLRCPPANPRFGELIDEKFEDIFGRKDRAAQGFIKGNITLHNRQEVDIQCACEWVPCCDESPLRLSDTIEADGGNGMAGIPASMSDCHYIAVQLRCLKTDFGEAQPLLAGMHTIRACHASSRRHVRMSQNHAPESGAGSGLSPEPF